MMNYVVAVSILIVSITLHLLFSLSDCYHLAKHNLFDPRVRGASASAASVRFLHN